MSEKVYIVTLKKYEDLDGFYSDMSSGGYKLHMKRPISRNTQYYMTAEQAEEIKKDSRVLDVELNLEDAGIIIAPFALQNNTPYSATGTYRKAATGNYTATDLDWGKIHCAGTDADRGKGTFGTDGTTSKTATANVFNDGKHVDVVICDNQVSTDMNEWEDGSGNSRFKDYDWYTELNSYISTIDDDSQTIPSAPYNNYFSNATNKTYHGTHVAGTACGKTYGWAREANIYSMQVLGNAAGQGTQVPTLLMFDYLRAFHKYKPINSTTGRRNPTVTNHSWGTFYELESWNINDIVQIVWRGSTYSSTAGVNNPSGWTLNGIEADFGIAQSKTRIPRSYTSINADVEDAIADGVVVIAAAGNSDYYSVPQQNPDGTQHQDYDNYIWFSNQSPNTYNFCRGSSPASAQGVITVGWIDYTKNFQRDAASNFGPLIDVWAPGNQTISCWGKPGVIVDSDGNVLNIGIADTKYGGDNYCYPISGTSMASPQVCGIAASLATNKERFTNSDVLGYIQKHTKVGDMAFDVGPTYGQTSYTFNVTAFNSGEYTITGSDANGAVSGGNPTITCTAGDTLTFIPPPPSSAYAQITSANTTNGYGMAWSDRTNWHVAPGNGQNPTTNRPTINIEVGDSIDFGVATNMGTHPLYIKTAPSVGSGNQVTTGTTYGQGSVNGTGWDTSTGSTVTPGTYYYVCGAHSGMGGQIIVHNAGTYYDHALYIKTVQGSGTGNQVTGATNQGTNHNKLQGNLVWTPTVAGTYYYQCAMHGGMNGQIIVQAATGVLGQNGNFADPTCQKDSPNAYILCENPRPTSGEIKQTLGERISEQKAGESRQMFPRTKTIYEQR